MLSEEIDFSLVRSGMIVIVDFVNSRKSPLGRLDKLHSTQSKSDLNGALKTFSSDHIRGPRDGYGDSFNAGSIRAILRHWKTCPDHRGGKKKLNSSLALKSMKTIQLPDR